VAFVYFIVCDFQQEFLLKSQFSNEGKEDADEDEDFKAVQSGFVSLYFSCVKI